MRSLLKLFSLVAFFGLALCPVRHGVAASPKAVAAGSIIDAGTLQGASYRIDIPANWNHELIVFYHGYALERLTFTAQERLSPMFDPMLSEGYAVIQSGYSAGGWAIEQAAADSERLRRHFTDKHGAPKRTFVMGMSMGGALTAMAIESQPEIYAGALSLCGVLEPSDRMIQRDLALRAAFDYYFPDTLGKLVPLPNEREETVESKIAAALQSKPAAAQALLRWYGAADARNLAPVIAFAGYEIAELQRRAHGLPVGNAQMIYVGSGDDAALNDGVSRYSADADAAVYLARWYTPTGRLTRPFLELHDTGDPLVPASGGAEYALAVQRNGHGDNFVQQYINREGHCVFTPKEIGHAFDEVVQWIDSGKRPASGKLN
jgi:pimeloyl-ACP methyl ester carboxylesterase